MRAGRKVRPVVSACAGIVRIVPSTSLSWIVCLKQYRSCRSTDESARADRRGSSGARRDPLHRRGFEVSRALPSIRSIVAGIASLRRHPTFNFALSFPGVGDCASGRCAPSGGTRRLDRPTLRARGVLRRREDSTARRSASFAMPPGSVQTISPRRKPSATA
jgi:hypothetical protein